MKITISIPDDDVEAADVAARRIGISRSQLFVEAVTMFLREHGERSVTGRLNEVYAEATSELDPVLVRMQLMALHPDGW